jgi:hypothetical protein
MAHAVPSTATATPPVAMARCDTLVMVAQFG